MKDPLEEALKGMRPAEMPPQLMARLTAARPQPAAKRAEGLWRRWFLPLATAGCAGAAALAFLQSTEGPQLPAAPPAAMIAEALPFERHEFLVGSREVGVFVAPNQRAYRVMEIEWLEQDTIRAGQSGPAVRVETTRRDIVPVALEIF